MVVLPKPYPPTKITYLNWDTVIDYVVAHGPQHEPAGDDEVHDIDILNTGTLLSAHEPRHIFGGLDDIDSALDARAIALTAQGSVPYRAAAANTLAELVAGNDGQVFRTGGAGANPAWVDDVQPPDWILWESGGVYYGKNGQTGEIPYSGANFVTAVWDNVVGSDRHIHFKSGTTIIDDDMDITAFSDLLVTFSKTTIEQSTFDKNHFHLTGACKDVTFVGPANLWYSDALMPTAGACFMIGDGTNSIHNFHLNNFHFGGGNAVMGGGVFTSGNIFFRGLSIADKVYGLIAGNVWGNECVHDFILVGSPKTAPANDGGNHQFHHMICDNTNFPDDGVIVDGTTFPLNANGDGCGTGCGIHVTKSQGTWFTDMIVNRFTIGFYLDPDAADYCDHVRFFDCDADANDQEGLRAVDDNATTGRIWNAIFVGCFFGGNNDQGAVIDEVNEVREVLFDTCTFMFNYNEGVRLEPGPNYISFDQCRFRDNNGSNTGKYNVHIVALSELFYFTDCMWMNSAFGGLDLFLGDWCGSFRITGQTIATFTQNFPMVGGFPATDHEAYWVSLAGWGNTKTDFFYEANATVRSTSVITPIVQSTENNPLDLQTDIAIGGPAYLSRLLITAGNPANEAVVNMTPDGANIVFQAADTYVDIFTELLVRPDAVNYRFKVTDTDLEILQRMTYVGAPSTLDIGTAAGYPDDVFADTFHIHTPGAGAAHVTAFDDFDDLALINEVYPTVDGNILVRERYGIAKDGFINMMVERSLFIGAFKQIKREGDVKDGLIADLVRRVEALELQIGAG